MSARRELDGLIERTTDAGTQPALTFDPSTERWGEDALDVIRYLARTGRHFTADDVRHRAGDPPSPNSLGAVLRSAARSGLIRQVDWAISDRVSSHGRAVRLWVGVT